MSFTTGKDASVFGNGYDLAQYLRGVDPKLTAEVHETTVIKRSSKTYIPGLKDGSVSAEGFFDGDADAIDEIFEAALGQSDDSLLLVFPRGDATQGNPGWAMRALQTTYDVDAPVGGVVACSADFQESDDAERVISLHPFRTETAAGNGPIYAGSAQSEDGAAAHLHVTGLVGANVVVKVQHSSTADFSGDVADLITFASITASHRAARGAATGTIKRYVRWVISGTFTSVTFVLAFARK